MLRVVLVLSAIVATAGACAVSDDEVQQLGAGPTNRPSTLSFVVEDDPAPRAPRGLTVGAPATLWVTTDTRAHSGPDTRYTVLAELRTGDTVDSTGVRVDSNGEDWVEITTSGAHFAWVQATALRAG